jgi:hypothetical protein
MPLNAAVPWQFKTLPILEKSTFGRKSQQNKKCLGPTMLLLDVIASSLHAINVCQVPPGGNNRRWLSSLHTMVSIGSCTHQQGLECMSNAVKGWSHQWPRGLAERTSKGD